MGRADENGESRQLECQVCSTVVSTICILIFKRSNGSGPSSLVESLPDKSVALNTQRILYILTDK